MIHDISSIKSQEKPNILQDSQFSLGDNLFYYDIYDNSYNPAAQWHCERIYAVMIPHRRVVSVDV